MKKSVVKLLYKALKKKGLKLKKKEIESMIEIPPSHELGDFAFPCYAFSEKLKKEPHQIALELREEMNKYPQTDFEDIQTKGPYVNFFVNRSSLAREVIWEILNKRKEYGSSGKGKGKKVVVEFSSPNVAKPFGIGHLRSTIIGNSLANIFEFQKYKVKRINYLGDWGTQFGKLIYGYKKFGNEKKLQKNPMDHLYKVYVKSNKKKYEKKGREWFKKMENGNKEALMLWRLFRSYSLNNAKKIYQEMDIEFDKYEAESDYVKKTKEVIENLRKKELLKKSKGALLVDLQEHKLKKALIEKSDGTTLYSTRDLAAAISRKKKYKFDKMIYETGQEQKLYFKQMFKILELMGYKWAKDLTHVDHGLYLDKNGKKFSTRKGKTVFMEEVLEKTKTLTKKEIKKRAKKISKEEIDNRALKVAIAAIFYGDLKNNRRNDIVFDIKKFTSFEGDTGPYLLYSYARATSITEKSKKNEKYEIKEMGDKEIKLVKKLSDFPQVVEEAEQNLNPSEIANYSYQLSQAFNEFYHTCKVIGSEQEMFRLALVECFREVLRNALHLLGIETMEKM